MKTATVLKSRGKVAGKCYENKSIFCMERFGVLLLTAEIRLYKLLFVVNWTDILEMSVAFEAPVGVKVTTSCRSKGYFASPVHEKVTTDFQV